MVLTLFALGGAQCALLAVISLKTQKNEIKIFKKVQICPTHHPPRSPPSPTFPSICTFKKFFFSFFGVLRAITAVRAHCALPQGK